MSTKKPILAFGLTVLGFLRPVSAPAAADAQPLSPTPEAARSGSPEKPGEGHSPPAPPENEQGIILLTDGQVIRGTLVHDDTGCLVKTPFGSMQFPERRIVKTFRTLREAYEYKLSQFPEEDTQERLKLAQWCLTQDLQQEAKEQLQGILKINPKHPPAKAMLEKMEQTEARLARRKIDPDVQQAKATPEDMTGLPKQLDSAALLRSRSRPAVAGIADVPEIFNLPRPIALKINDEFNRSIHPILQAYCAKCHNERYPGDFQLLQIRSRRDLNRDTLRLNLEATLQLIDPLNPSRSEILSSPLRPHGLGKTKRPIFRGSNDLAYQKISAWVESICKPLKMDTLRQASTRPDSAADTERFAVDRVPNLGEPAAYPSSPRRPRSLQGAMEQSTPPQQIDTQPGPGEFPLGALPIQGGLRATGNAQLPNGPPGRSGTMPQPAAPPSAVTIPPPATIGRTAQAASAADALPELPPEAATTPSTTSKPKKPKTPVKIDPAMLELMLKARNGGN
jgi:hypothetical protein